MNVSVVAISDRKSPRLKRVARAVAEEFKLMGHSVELIDTPDYRLASSLFIAVVSEPKGLGSSIGDKLRTELAQCQSLVGKRSMALLVKSGFFPSKALGHMMKALEKEGMVVTTGEVAASTADAVAAARGAPVVKG